MRIVPTVCEKCGKTYRYMVSAYGMSPSDWNKARGVTFKYCAECSKKTFIRPELHCPPIQRLRSSLWGRIHNWLMRYSRWYRKRWRGGREPAKPIDMGPVAIKPYPKIDLSEIYQLEFDIERENGESIK